MLGRDALMAEKTSVRGFFEFLAAGEMGGLVAACGAALLPGPAGLLMPAAGKAIEYFGPALARRLLDFLSRLGEPSGAAVLEMVANTSSAEAQRSALEAVQTVAPSATPESQRLAAQYLSAIPGSLRRSLVVEENGRSSCPLDLLPRNSEDALRMLPTSIPPYIPPCALPGTDYQLTELIGTGGFGAVYLASHKTEYEPRAIKLCLDPARLQSLRREQSLLGRLIDKGGAWSANIVRLYGHRLDADPAFLVYEYVQKGDLASFVRERRHELGRPLNPEEVLDAIDTVAAGLAVAHPAGLVHRDLKPSNILWSGTTLKLADFGLGAVACEPEGARGDPRSNLDMSVELHGSGTPLYMCEEQRHSTRPDPRHDVYSLGVIWYQMLVDDLSRRLTPGWEDVLKEHDVPSTHVELLGRCIRGITNRPADGREVCAAIERIRLDRGVQGGGLSDRQDRFKRRRYLISLVSAVTLASAIFGLRAYYFPPKPPDIPTPPPAKADGTSTVKKEQKVGDPIVKKDRPQESTASKTSKDVAIKKTGESTKPDVVKIPPKESSEPASKAPPAVGDFAGTWRRVRQGEPIDQQLTFIPDPGGGGALISGAIKGGGPGMDGCSYEYDVMHNKIRIYTQDKFDNSKETTLVEGRPVWGNGGTDGCRFEVVNMKGPAEGKTDTFKRVDAEGKP
jgi:serine/threonine protein kinase